MNLNEYFNRGMVYDDYISHLGEKLEMHVQHYNRCTIEEDTENEIKHIKNLKLIVLTDPTCGDSLAILPIVRKISEINGSWDMRILIRDDNLDLMDQFLTRGGRAVPLFFFLEEDYSLVFHWGPRPKIAQQIYEDHRKMIENKEIEKLEVIKKIRYFYSRDKGQAIISELLTLFKEYNCMI